MLQLKLRDEFLGRHTPDTAIALRRKDKSGVAEKSPDYILSITYPTNDVQKALRAISDRSLNRPIVLKGERGRGKSHIMGIMHHALNTPEKIEAWTNEWSENHSNMSALRDLKIKKGYFPISEPVHNHEYKVLWDLLFDRHPEGKYFRGKFEQMKQPYPPRSLLEEMFEKQPVALILDEFQKWFDGLHNDPGASGKKWQEWASNFVQNLSELSVERPDLLIFVISVLNNETEAFRQVHRNSPTVIDFSGPTAKQDRQKLVLHRLFENRDKISESEIIEITGIYASERFRLRFSHLSEAEKNRITNEVIESWPFSPELTDLLEDHILMAQAAQETRDLIRILATIYRSRGDDVPIITPADFFVDDDECGVQTLIDSIATSAEQADLREVAQRNLEGISDSGIEIPHAKELISALWMRSMAPSTPQRKNGGTRQELQLDITREHAIDNNAFRAELTSLIENSFNIHGEESGDGRLWFGMAENPRTRVRITARNNRLWEMGSHTGDIPQSEFAGKDVAHIRNTLKHILTPETRSGVSKVIVLNRDWNEDPWLGVEENEKPERWDQPVIVVVPAPLNGGSGNINRTLGEWLKNKITTRRNTVRFLLPKTDLPNIYDDSDLIMLSRCSYLTSIAWKSEKQYNSIKDDFDKPLRDALKTRYDRFAVLQKWNFQNPELCSFEIERIDARGSEIPSHVDKKIREDLFDSTDFETLVIEHSRNLRDVGDLFNEISEPPTNDQNAIPYLGETLLYEEILKIAAKGAICLNVGGYFFGRLPSHLDEADALRHLKSKAMRTGRELHQIEIRPPEAMGGTSVGITPVPAVRPVVIGTGGQQPLTGPTPQPVVIPGIPPIIQPDDIGGIPPIVQPPRPSVQTKLLKTESATTGINLSGYFERWGVSNQKTLDEGKIAFKNLTVDQMKQILQRIPPSFQAEMEIVYREDE